MNGIDDCTKDILQPELEGLNGVNRQPSNGQNINRQNGIFLPSTVK